MIASKVASKVGGRYDIVRHLGEGRFSQVESFQQDNYLLQHESEILKELNVQRQEQGIAKWFYYGEDNVNQYMVSELLGKTIQAQLETCGGKFHVTTVLLIAEQIQLRIQYLHARGFIHRDIKPENFMFGVAHKAHHLYLIDFGLAKQYFDLQHINMKNNLSLTGTARYASINALRGCEQSRRDDLEAIGYMLIYLIRGSLPWSGLAGNTAEEKYKNILAKKLAVKVNDLCSGLPYAFEAYLCNVRNLNFSETPDYKSMRKLFQSAQRDFHGLECHHYPWLSHIPSASLEPLHLDCALRQPDNGALCLDSVFRWFDVWKCSATSITDHSV